MADDSVKGVAKNGLPFLIVSVACGYATDLIPEIFPAGDFRDWAYRTIPFLSLILLFVIRTIKDFGGMSFTRLLFAICASPEKKRLKATMGDSNASEATKTEAQKRYDRILQQELEIGGRLVNYISQWSIFKKAPTPPPSLD
ncbi:hypothetical protein [Klebsiella quasipneumoniae]|uniref:hypothetical protein n=1 Tax=Klebsiella quasipneumoniae TaxID=1463165 RepID=UPI00244A7051|nr:hypothetical protein [Klebsiella quasipneumoniae]MDH2670283.1 hypothetical protein [Klebsiella quasipneumoniae]